MRRMRGLRVLGMALIALGLMALTSARAQAEYEEANEIEDYERDKHLKENGETVIRLQHLLKEQKVTHSKTRSYISGEVATALLVPGTVKNEISLTTSVADQLRAPQALTKFLTTTEAIKSQPTNTKAHANSHLKMSPVCSS